MMSEQTSQQHLKMIKCFLKSKSLLLLLYKVCFEKLEFLVENQIRLHADADTAEDRRTKFFSD